MLMSHVVMSWALRLGCDVWVGTYIKHVEEILLRDNPHKVVICLIKVPTASLDTKCLFLCPLFASIVDVEDLDALFAATATSGTK